MDVDSKGLSNDSTRFTGTEYTADNQCIRVEESYGDKAELMWLDKYFISKRKSLFPQLTFSASALRNGKLMSDPVYEDAIIRELLSSGWCLLKAPEGRGKTILSMFVADRLLERGYSIFKTRKNWNWDTVRSLIDPLLETDKRALFILEDVHLLGEESNDILDYIAGVRDSLYAEEDSNQFLFLLNFRPSLETVDKTRINSSRLKPLVDLTPEWVQKERAIRLSGFLAHRNHLNLEDLTIDGEKLSQNPQRNLRVLSRVFDVFTNPLKPSFSATEGDVIHLYYESFKLDEYSLDCKKQALALLGALGVFEAPVDVDFLTKEEREVLHGFRHLGLCFNAGKKYYLDHSTEARYLCRALCETDSDDGHDSSYVAMVSEAIRTYFNRIIDSTISEEKRMDVAKNFVSPVLQQLHLVEGFGSLYDEFRKPEIATIVIQKLYPSYIINAVYTNGGDSSYRKKIYEDNKAFLKEHILELPPQVLLFLDLTLRNHCDTGGMVRDLFYDEDGSIAKAYVEKQIEEHRAFRNSSFRNRLKNLSDNHRRIIDTYIEEHSYSEPVINGARQELYAYRKEIDSKRKSKAEVRPICEKLIEEVRMRLQSAPTKESSETLSRFINEVSLIDDGLYKQILNDPVFLSSASCRLSHSRFEKGDLYLFSHYYLSNVGFAQIVNNKILAANDYEKKNMKAWIDLIRENNPDIVEFDENTLAYFIEKVL